MRKNLSNRLNNVHTVLLKCKKNFFISFNLLLHPYKRKKEKKNAENLLEWRIDFSTVSDW